jgi:hypothetical protein
MIDCQPACKLSPRVSSKSSVPARWARRAALGLSLLVCGGVAAGEAQSTAADLVLHRTVTYADRQTYIEVPFDVGEGVTRITVDCSYTERDRHTVIDLGMFDGERFRGWSGGNKSSFTVSETDATPSYLAGPVRPGRWKLILGIPNIEKDVRSEFTATIHFERKGDVAAVSTFSAAPLRTGSAWYRGDLHMHDAHSDGSCMSRMGHKVPCPLYKTVEAAAARGLDFIAITDHNTTSHFNVMRELQPYFDNLLLMPGREITTFEGHANVFGTTTFIDFRLTSPNVPDINTLLEKVREAHGMFSINHPGLPSGAICMGCGWSAPDTDFSKVDAIEALNGDASDGPYAGIPFWQGKLNKGFRITGIAGSDNHNADLPPEARSAVGHPTTVVYAPELSERAILEGIRAGHVFIDGEGTKDRLIEFTARAGGHTASMGDALQANAGEKVQFVVKTVALAGAHIEVIQDGRVTGLLDASPIKLVDETREFIFQSDGKKHWVRVNVRSETGTLLVVGNPVYLNY